MTEAIRTEHLKFSYDAQSESGGENRKTSHNGHTGIRDDNNTRDFIESA